MKKLPNKVEIATNGLSIVDFELPGVIVATANTPEMAEAIANIWNSRGDDVLKQEGWAHDLTAKRGKTHYYKNGLSLCRLASVKFHFKNFSKRGGNKYFHDCGNCIAEQKKMQENGN